MVELKSLATWWALQVIAAVENIPIFGKLKLIRFSVVSLNQRVDSLVLLFGFLVSPFVHRR